MTTTPCSNDQRLLQINLAFNSPEFQKQLNKWEEQRTILRKLVCKFWKNYQNQFQDYWKKSEFDVRTALILTAFEDLPDLVCSILTAKTLENEKNQTLKTI
jgi:5-methylthioribose kinase